MFKIEYLNASMDLAVVTVDVDDLLGDAETLVGWKGQRREFVMPMSRLITAMRMPEAVANPTEDVNRLPALDAA